MNFLFRYTIIEKISNFIADGRKAIWAIYESEDKIFTQSDNGPEDFQKAK